MALPPTIPTSFLPQQGGPARSARWHFDFIGALYFIAYLIFFLSLVAAAALFLYSRFLTSEQASKDAALVAAEAKVDQGTIASLVTLEQQLTQGKQLLDQHVVLSSFFDALQQLTPTTVSYQSLSATILSDHSATVSISGAATSFNALAVLSANLATNPSIKDAIFSGISVTKGVVDFTLSATLDPALVEIPPQGFTPAAQPAVSLPATTTKP